MYISIYICLFNLLWPPVETSILFGCVKFSAFLTYWPPVETSILFGHVKFSLLTTSVNIYSLLMQVA